MILLVDDDQGLRDALVGLVALKGYSVQCAADGDEALSWLGSSKIRPTLILLDLVMPVLDGWGFLTEMRSNPQLADIPVVIMSGASNVSERAKKLGAVAVARKPVEPETLLRLVDRFSA